MMVYLNGEYLEESVAKVPVTDRGFLFGDAVFETLRTVKGKPLLWSPHLARFWRGADLLGIPVPLSAEGLSEAVDALLHLNQMPDAVLRITLTRGSGPRGYSPKGADQPRLVITSQLAPEPFGGRGDGWDVVTSRWRVPSPGPLSEIKHANRLTSILARAEADAAGAQEALQLCATGQVAEASGSNVAWLVDGTLVAPGPDTGALAGVMQDYVLRAAVRLGWPCQRSSMAPEGLWEVDGVFLTNSVHLLVPMRSLDGRALRISPKIGILMGELQDALLVERR